MAKFCIYKWSVEFLLGPSFVMQGMVLDTRIAYDRYQNHVFDLQWQPIGVIKVISMWCKTWYEPSLCTKYCIDIVKLHTIDSSSDLLDMFRDQLFCKYRKTGFDDSCLIPKTE